MALIITPILQSASITSYKKTTKTVFKALLGLSLAAICHTSFAACTTQNASLTKAQTQFSKTCSRRAKDCDRIEGIWVCSSQNISAKKLSSLGLSKSTSRKTSVNKSTSSGQSSNGSRFYTKSGSDQSWSKLLSSKKSSRGEPLILALVVRALMLKIA